MHAKAPRSEKYVQALAQSDGQSTAGSTHVSAAVWQKKPEGETHTEALGTQ